MSHYWNPQSFCSSSWYKTSQEKIGVTFNGWDPTAQVVYSLTDLVPFFVTVSRELYAPLRFQLNEHPVWLTKRYTMRHSPISTLTLMLCAQHLKNYILIDIAV